MTAYIFCDPILNEWVVDLKDREVNFVTKKAAIAYCDNRGIKYEIETYLSKKEVAP